MLSSVGPGVLVTVAVAVFVGVPGVAFVLVAVGVAVRVAVLVAVLVAVGVVPSPVTFTVPIINGCWLQKYWKEPAELNVNEKVPPVLSSPESHPPVRVLVWANVPLFVHVTISPTAILVVAG
jgi:hypothetical protein